ncbi:MAG: exopolygalacturonase [Bacteroidaceae bacterium]|nr:exopolygalacturonase [Bacteroidaceae bacterium]
MKKLMLLLLATALVIPTSFAAKKAKKKVELFPDGTEIPEWFRQNEPVNIEKLGKKYVLTDYEIFADGRLHTAEIQALIDKAAADGGGVIVVPRGTFMTGGLKFKQGTHLYLEDGATLMGSDFIGDYPLGKTRIEGETCTYFGALINADGLDGFTISGKGTIDGNGLRYHKQFWLRRKWNPKCTNKDEQRPRLVYVSNCKNVQIEGVKLQNSAFWTTHIYNSENVKLLNLSINSLSKPNHAKGPSTDAIDLDVVKNVLVKGCYMSVNDDAIAMKGGKGPWADDPTKSEGNGGNENVIIEDCTYGFCHGCLTCGSESIYNHNIILRRIQVDEAARLLWLKMRPDTPQRYEYITVEDITGTVGQFIYIQPWTQFYDLKDRKDPPMSYSDHITMRNCKMEVGTFFNVKRQDDQYKLSNFHFENLDIKVKKNATFNQSYVEGFTVKDVNITQ